MHSRYEGKIKKNALYRSLVTPKLKETLPALILYSIIIKEMRICAVTVEEEGK